MFECFNQLKEQFRGLIVIRDQMSSGHVWYGLTLGIKHITIEQTAGCNYGLHLDNEEGFDFGPDETVHADHLVNRVIELLLLRT